MKRYAIVRVDNNYGPCVLEKEKVPICKTDELCYSGKCPYRYGDTKEQLIKKVAQAIVKRYFKNFSGSKFCIDIMYREYLEVAKEIVEFLGVE